jgi:hypothetical protein
MSEEEIRSFFERLEEVRDRWSREVRTVYGEYFRYLAHSQEIEVLYAADDYYAGWSVEQGYIPILALTDFEAAAAPVLEKKRREEERKTAQDAAYRRQQYEKLRAEFGA